jgi:hypothetical protein
VVQGENFLGHRDGPGEQQPPPVSGVPHPLRDSGQEGENRSVDGVLKQEGGVKSASPQLPRLPEHADGPGVASVLVVHLDIVDVRVMPQEFGDKGFGDYRDPRLRARRAHRPKGRSRKDGIAQPVDGPNEKRAGFTPWKRMHDGRISN